MKFIHVYGTVIHCFVALFLIERFVQHVKTFWPLFKAPTKKAKKKRAPFKPLVVVPNAVVVALFTAQHKSAQVDAISPAVRTRSTQLDSTRFVIRFVAQKTFLLRNVSLAFWMCTPDLVFGITHYMCTMEPTGGARNYFE